MRNLTLSTQEKMTLLILLSLGLITCSSIISPLESWDSDLGPVVPHDSFPADCSLCHEGGDWANVQDDFEFDHEKETGVALAGAHENASCLLCHNDRGPVAQFAAKGCAGCHEDLHQGKLGQSCDDCHNEQTWRPQEAIAKHTRTRFPLVGAHASVDCSQCHEGATVGNFEALDTSCVTCHSGDLTRATSPDHVTQGWTDDCQRCHVPINWNQAQFNHPSSFPLAGGHRGQNCSVCHLGSTFEGLSADCSSCHLTDYQNTTDPNHVASNFSLDCMTCHSINSWQGASFDHPGSFPLTNGHNIQDCSACHVGGIFANLPTDCASCHLPDYQDTTDPNHAASGFDLDCTVCHTTSAWQGATIAHPNTFPLANGHNIQDCSSCHIGGVLTSLPTDCASCHLPDYQDTTDPNHTASGFDMDCTICHTTSTWQGASVAHPSSFPLTQGHNIQDCSSCHIGGVLTSLPTECASCHLPDYQGTTDPNHAASGFDMDCTVCHTTSTWQGASVAHPSSFPLTQGHNIQDCSSCHIGGVLTSLPTDCASCHLPDYQGTTDPNHAASGFDMDCTVCHTTSTWQGASITHPSSFPLTQGHNLQDCSRCHIGGVLTSIPADCASCHLPDYQNTNNPNHVISGFSTDCTTCHSTNTWSGATFNHRFPINSGDHRGLSCTDCHLTPGNSSQFSCTHCHEHTQPDMADDHSGVGGYVWSSPSCLDCHPNGQD